MRNTTSTPKLMSMQQTNRIVCLITFICLSVFSVQGQDMHFTNNNITPTFFNPAQTGNFSGTVRAGLIFRDQMFIIKSGADASPFQTFGLGVDAPVIFGFSKNHWVAAGLNIVNDRLKLGTLGNPDGTPNDPASLITSRFSPSIAYHIGLDKKFKSVISFGIQYGLSSLRFEGTGFRDNLTITGRSGADAVLEMIKTDGKGGNASYGSINVGVSYKSILSKTSSIMLGASVMHLQQPSFIIEAESGVTPTTGDRNSIVPRRINLHASYRTKNSKRLTLEPRLNASFAPTGSNIQLQFRSEYLLKPKGDIALIIGAGYRLNGSPQFLTGAVYKDWTFSLSYDHNLTEVSQVSPSTIELGASKIFTLNKKPDPKPIIYCPRI